MPKRFMQDVGVLTDADWKRLGDAVRARRGKLGMTVAECTAGRNISDTTWGKLESGQPISGAKLRLVAPAIRWEPESVDLVLGGGSPIETPLESPAISSETVAIIEEVASLTAELARRAREGQL